jgi:hypothetical protein
MNGTATTTMASASTSGTSGYQSPEDTTITSATIDNSSNFYYLDVSWPKESSGLLTVFGVRIRYTVTSPLP